MPLAVIALAAGAFGIGTTEFVIMGLLLQVAGDFGVSVPMAGVLISGYALGVVVGAPLLTIATRRMPRKAVLVALMAIFTIGNAACALAPDYNSLLAARIVTALAHGTFFGVGSVVATGLVAPDRRASAIATMFAGLTIATLLGVPFGAWLGGAYGWRSAFWAVTAIGVVAMIILIVAVPRVPAETPAPIGQELAALRRLQVLLGLAMTVFGFAGLFTVFTYIEPILRGVTGLTEAQVSPVLLVFGAGLAAGNWIGGRLADRAPAGAVTGTFAVLAAVLLALTFAFDTTAGAIAAVFVLGTASFATVAPLQLRVLDQAGEAGRTLASSVNIAAFNLGNALGAALGALVIAAGGGLRLLPLVATAVTLAGLALAAISVGIDRRSLRHSL